MKGIWLGCLALAATLGCSGGGDVADADAGGDTSGPACTIPAGERPAFAHQLTCPADFEALAWRPPDAAIPGAKSSKTIVDTADSDALYFLNAETYPMHYAFAQKYLSGKGKPLVKDASSFSAREYFSPTRRFLLGAVTYYEGAGVWAYEIAPYDTASADMVMRAWDLLVAAAFFGPQLRFHPTSDAVALLLPLLPERVKIVTTAELFAGMSFQPLNPGVAVGQLRFYQVQDLEAQSAWVTPRDVAVLDAVPNDLSVVAGLITAELQTPLSHVNVLSQNRGTPNMALVGAQVDSKLKSLQNKWVRLTVTAFDWQIEEVTQAEADTWWASHKPGVVKVPDLDLTVAELRDCTQVSATDTAIFGGKASNYGQLCQIPTLPVPPAFAVPVFYYHQFALQNGLYDKVAALEADPKFVQDPAYHQAKLQELREFVLAAPLDPAFLQTLRARLDEKFPNQRVRLRSSTNAEDLDGFTGAGLYTSKTWDPADPTSVLEDQVRKVFASLWNDRAFEERAWRGIPNDRVAMALLVHRGFPTEDANGVALTNNLFDPMQPAFYINVQKGDTPVVRPPGDGVTAEQFLYFYAYPGQPITYLGQSTLVGAGKTVLTVDQVHELGKQLVKVHEAFAPIYAKPGKFYAMDVEFKFDTAPGDAVSKVWIKQARPHQGWAQ
jgi:pyruvate,water dikinase